MSIFGSGYLTTHAVAAEIKAAEDVIDWELSEHEKEIIDALTK